MPGYSHPKCYARKTNKCSEKISGEHIISDNILELFEHDKTVKITGLPWIEHQTFNLLSRKALVSNILCSHHNSLLSKYDTEAGQLMRCIGEYDAGFNNPNPANEHRTFNGDYIERWMLKIVCGLVASKQVSSGGSKVEVSLSDQLVDILFEGAKFPDKWGLYFKVPDAGVIHHFGSVGFMPLTGNGEVKAGDFLLNNLQFYLLLGNPDHPGAWGTRRVEKIIFKQGDISKIIEFTWEDKQNSAPIELNRIATTREHPKEWAGWMKK